MPLRSTRDQYGSLAKLLHWAIALLIFYLLYLGFTMGDMAMGLEKIKRYGLHKSLGMSVLTLAGIRLLWRLSGPAPALPVNLRWYERRAAQVTHGMLYGLMFLMPLSGWLMSSAAGFPVSPFGWFTMPDLIAPSKDARHFWHEAHEIIAFVLIGLIALHVIGALYHHFYYRDDVLRRMLPFRGKRA